MSELTASADGGEADTPVELILLRCPEVFCYKVPPQASAAGHRAEDWNLGEPRFTGLLHLVGVGSTIECRVLKQDDGDDAPVAVCPVRTGEKAPPVDAVVCAVVDSSRYFVFRCEDAKGRRAYLGVGFRERDQAYDFKASIDDFVREARALGKRVLVRVDFNVPMDGGTITDDTRIQAALPTIQAILDAGGTPILMSHLGRPKGAPDPQYSLRPVAATLDRLTEADVVFCEETVGDAAQACVDGAPEGAVVLLQVFEQVLYLMVLRGHGEHAGTLDMCIDPVSLECREIALVVLEAELLDERWVRASLNFSLKAIGCLTDRLACCGYFLARARITKELLEATP